MSDVNERGVDEQLTRLTLKRIALIRIAVSSILRFPPVAGQNWKVDLGALSGDFAIRAI
jgi:hypothetical protein